MSTRPLEDFRPILHTDFNWSSQRFLVRIFNRPAARFPFYYTFTMIRLKESTVAEESTRTVPKVNRASNPLRPCELGPLIQYWFWETSLHSSRRRRILSPVAPAVNQGPIWSEELFTGWAANCFKSICESFYWVARFGGTDRCPTEIWKLGAGKISTWLRRLYN